MVWIGAVAAFLIFATGPDACASPIGESLSAIKLAESQYFAEGSTQTLAEFSQELEGIYAALRKSSMPSLADLRKEDMQDLFDALDLMGFYSERIDIVRLQGRLFVEMEKRGLANEERVRSIHHNRLLIRDVKEANELGQRYENLLLPKVPQIQAKAFLRQGMRLLEVTADRNLKTTRLTPRVPHIVMLAGPNCAPSRRALSDIESDPDLASVFQNHATLVAPPHALDELDDIVKWNFSHPTLKIGVAYSSRDWPYAQRMSTPTFLLFKDGVAAQILRGWKGPSEDRKADLRKAMTSIGVLLPATPPSTSR